MLSAAARDWLVVARVLQEMAQRRAAAQIWFCRSGRQLQPLAAEDSAATRVVANGDLRAMFHCLMAGVALAATRLMPHVCSSLLQQPSGNPC